MAKGGFLWTRAEKMSIVKSTERETTRTRREGTMNGTVNYWDAIAKRLADRWIAGQALPGTWAKARMDEAWSLYAGKLGL